MHLHCGVKAACKLRDRRLTDIPAEAMVGVEAQEDRAL